MRPTTFAATARIAETRPQPKPVLPLPEMPPTRPMMPATMPRMQATAARPQTTILPVASLVMSAS